jgi:hypothetical protein
MARDVDSSDILNHNVIHCVFGYQADYNRVIALLVKPDVLTKHKALGKGLYRCHG